MPAAEVGPAGAAGAAPPYTLLPPQATRPTVASASRLSAGTVRRSEYEPVTGSSSRDRSDGHRRNGCWGVPVRSAAGEPRRRGVRSTDVGVLPADDDRLVRELYAQHAAPLRGYVRTLVGGDTARAEDVVQEALIRAWQHPAAFDTDRPGGASVRGWLFTVARNLVTDGWRRRAARPDEVPDRPVALAVEDRRLEQVLVGLELSDALASLSVD